MHKTEKKPVKSSEVDGEFCWRPASNDNPEFEKVTSKMQFV